MNRFTSPRLFAFYASAFWLTLCAAAIGFIMHWPQIFVLKGLSVQTLAAISIMPIAFLWTVLGIMGPSIYSQFSENEEAKSQALLRNSAELQANLNDIADKLRQLDQFAQGFSSQAEQKIELLHTANNAADEKVLMFTAYLNQIHEGASAEFDRVNQATQASAQILQTVARDALNHSQELASVGRSFEEIVSSWKKEIIDTEEKSRSLMANLKDNLTTLVNMSSEMERAGGAISRASIQAAGQAELGVARLEQGAEKLIQAGQEASDRADQSVRVFETIAEKTHQIGEALCSRLESAGELANTSNTVIKDTKNNIEDIIYSFKSSAAILSEQAALTLHQVDGAAASMAGAGLAAQESARQAEKLSTQIEASGALLNKTAQQVEEAVSRLEEGATRAVGVIRETANLALDDVGALANKGKDAEYNLREASKGLSDIATTLDQAVSGLEGRMHEVRVVSEQARATVQDINRDVGQAAQQLGQANEKMLETSKSSISIAAEALRTVLPANDKLVDASQRLRDETGRMRDEVEANASLIEKGMASVGRVANESVHNLREVASQFNEGVNSLSNTLSQANAPLKETQDLLGSVSSGMDRLSDAGGNLNERLRAVDESAKRVEQRFDHTAQSVEQAMERLGQEASRAHQRMAALSDGVTESGQTIKAILGEAEERLDNYANRALEKAEETSAAAAQRIDDVVKNMERVSNDMANTSEHGLQKLSRIMNETANDAKRVIEQTVDDIGSKATQTFANIGECAKDHASAVARAGIHQVAIIEAAGAASAENFRRAVDTAAMQVSGMVEKLDATKNGILARLAEEAQEATQIAERAREAANAHGTILSDKLSTSLDQMLESRIRGIQEATKTEVDRLTALGKEQVEKISFSIAQDLSHAAQVAQDLKAQGDTLRASATLDATAHGLARIPDEDVSKITNAINEKVEEALATAMTQISQQKESYEKGANLVENRVPFLQAKAALIDNLGQAGVHLAAILDPTQEPRSILSKVLGRSTDMRQRLNKMMVSDPDLRTLALDYYNECASLLNDARAADPSGVLEGVFASTEEIRLGEILHELIG